MAPQAPKPKNPERSISWFKRFQYDKERDSPSDARNVLLVIATLIAAVTFQAGVNPPGVWQDDGGGQKFHAPGSAIYASRKSPYYVFLLSNTLALSASILVITSLTYRFPFHFEIWVATASMMITYASAIFAVTPRTSVRLFTNHARSSFSAPSPSTTHPSSLAPVTFAAAAVQTRNLLTP